MVGLCGPVARGSLVMATSDGYLSLVDPRVGARAGEAAAAAAPPLLAHAGGFAAVDARGEFVATAGYSSRMGRMVLDNHVKVAE